MILNRFQIECDRPSANPDTKQNFFQTTVAILGIVGNSLASVILTRKEMRNAFNLLLVSMACFDSTYLFGSILESFRKQFNMASE